MSIGAGKTRISQFLQNSMVGGLNLTEAIEVQEVEGIFGGKKR